MNLVFKKNATGKWDNLIFSKFFRYKDFRSPIKVGEESPHKINIKIFINHQSSVLSITKRFYKRKTTIKPGGSSKHFFKLVLTDACSICTGSS